MKHATRAHHAPAPHGHDLDPVRLQRYVAQLRAWAHEWHERAGSRWDSEATRLRLRAQIALFAAHEAEHGS